MTTVFLLDQTGVVLNAVIDLGLPFNLISKLQAKQLQLQNGVAPNCKPYIIDGKLLQTYPEYKVDVFTTDLARKIAKINCIIIGDDIKTFHIILGQL